MISIKMKKKGVVDKISLHAKHKFLQNLHDSFKNVLSCCKCAGILKSNSLAFSCGHSFCEDCSDNIDSCVNCSNSGYKNSSKIGNLSKTLNIIYEIKNNFNAESVIFEMLKFLLSPPELFVKKETEIRKTVIVCNSPLALPCDYRKSKKFRSTGKRFKTLFNKTENTKRKLYFNTNVNELNVEQQNLVENDSECLFLDSTNRNKSDDDRKKKDRGITIQSYLDQQPSIADSPNFNTLKAYSRKSLKRKRSNSAYETGRTSVEKVFDKLLNERNNLTKRKLRGISQSFENNTKFEPDDCNVNSASKKRRSSKRLNGEAKSDNVISLEGMFLGFDHSQLVESYDKYKNAVLLSRVGDPNEMDIVSMPDGQTLTKKNSQIGGSEKAPDCSKYTNFNPKSPLLKKSIEKCSRNRIIEEKGAKKPKKTASVILGPELKTAMLVCANQNEVMHKSNLENSLKLSNIVEEKHGENLPKTLEADAKKEKETLLLSLQDTDAEDVVDVNIWENNDKVKRKKNSLFKSVKERKRKNLFFGQNEGIPAFTKPSAVLNDKTDSQNAKIMVFNGVDRHQVGKLELNKENIKQNVELQTEQSCNKIFDFESEKQESVHQKSNDRMQNLNIPNSNKKSCSPTKSNENRKQCIENLESDDIQNSNLRSVSFVHSNDYKNYRNKDQVQCVKNKFSSEEKPNPQNSNILVHVNRQRSAGLTKKIKDRICCNKNEKQDESEQVLDTGTSEKSIQDDAAHENNYEDRTSSENDQKQRSTLQTLDTGNDSNTVTNILSSSSPEELLHRIVTETIKFNDSKDRNQTPIKEDNAQNGYYLEMRRSRTRGRPKTPEMKNYDIFEIRNSLDKSSPNRNDLPAPHLCTVLTKIDDQKLNACNEKLLEPECVLKNLENSLKMCTQSKNNVEKSSCTPSQHNDVRVPPANNNHSKFVRPGVNKWDHSPNCADGLSPFKDNTNKLPFVDVGLIKVSESQTNSTRSNSIYAAPNINDISIVVKRLFGSTQTSDDTKKALDNANEFENLNRAEAKSIYEDNEGNTTDLLNNAITKDQNIVKCSVNEEIIENISEAAENKTNVFEEDGFENDLTKADIKSKCTELRKIVYDQNQKLLMNIKKSFKVTSPSLLRVEKCKPQKCLSPSLAITDAFIQDKNDYHIPEMRSSEEFVDTTHETSLNTRFTSLKQESSLNITNSFDKDTLNKIQPLPLTEPETNDEMLTLPSSPATKSVFCQTTPDLHLALLMREFPHIFKKSDVPPSVYDTPVESIGTERNRIENLKTPLTPLLNGREMYTVVSSITTSEKKIYEQVFEEHSVLSESFRSPASCNKSAISLNENISCFPLLPSTGKKLSSSHSPSADKQKLSVRLNFRNDCKETALFASTSNSDSSKIALMTIQNHRSNKDIVNAKVEEHDVTYCSGLNMISLNTSAASGECDENESKNESPVNKLSNESNEIDFANCVVVDEEMPHASVKKNISDDGTNTAASKNISIVPDSDFIVDSCNTINSIEFVESSIVWKKAKENEEANGVKNIDSRAASSERNCMNADDDDVDFIAGTPTCYAKRCVDDSLEKLRTQSMNARATEPDDIVAFAEKSDPVLFDSIDPKSEKSKSSIANLYPIVKNCEDTFFTTRSKNSANSTIENQPIIGKCSADLFESVSCKSTSTICMATSGLKEVEIKVVKLFCERFSALLLDKLTEKTTHLIVKTDGKDQTCRTFKYLQAVVNCITIVSVKWLEVCLDTGKILNEEKYIPFDSSGESGPLRAYNVKKGITPSPLSWLRDYCALFIEPVPRACTLRQLQDVVANTGATVINSLQDFKKYPAHHHLVIVSDEDENAETTNEEIANWIQIYQAIAIEFNWLLEVIGRNRLVPFAEYELVEIPNDLLLQLNFPIEMLQFERDDTEDSE